VSATDTEVKPSDTYRKPVDATYSLELADRCVALASEGRTPEQVCALLAPIARGLFPLGRREVPRRFYEAAGIERLPRDDLVNYASCVKDLRLRAEAYRRAEAAGGPDAPPKGSYIPALILTLIEAKDYAEAERELEGFLAIETVTPERKAGFIVGAASEMMLIGDSERAKKWLQRVLDDFPAQTRYVERAKKLIESGIKLPIGGTRK